MDALYFILLLPASSRAAGVVVPNNLCASTNHAALSNPLAVVSTAVSKTKGGNPIAV